MQWAFKDALHLVVVILACTVPFWPLATLAKYKLYLVYLGFEVLWFVCGKCPLTDLAAEEDVKYRPVFLHQLLRIPFPEMSYATYYSVQEACMVALLTIATARFAASKAKKK